MLLRALPIVGLVILTAASASAQGTLDRVRTEVRRPDRSSSDDDDNSALWGAFAGGLLAGMLVSDSEPPNPYDAPPPMRFLTFPYQGDYPGFMSKTFTHFPEYAEEWKGKIHLNRWFGRIALEEGYDFFDGVNRAGGSVMVDTSSRWGLQSTWSVLSERVGGPDNRHTDSMTLGDANVTYRLIQSPDVLIRAGAGARTLLDGPRTDWGWNVHLDSDFFIGKPLIVSTVFDYGSLGDAAVLHLRGTVGVVRRGWELYGGYDWLRIETVDIHGPMIGLRYWF